jgi:hypothetical protein
VNDSGTFFIPETETEWSAQQWTMVKRCAYGPILVDIVSQTATEDTVQILIL